MKFWLSVHLPLLQLECIRPRWSDPGPYAIIDNGKVTLATREAISEGARIGMRAAGVAAVAPHVVLIERNPEREARLYEAVAMALLQYTPEVATGADACLQLDVTASLTLFGGRAAICHRIKGSLLALGVTAQIGTAPTPMGAWLLSRWRYEPGPGIRRRTIKPHSMERNINRLPCWYLPAAIPHLDWLASIGAVTIGALRRLPRDGIKRRMTPHVIIELDRATGLVVELFRWFSVPETFSARIETNERIERADDLLAGAGSLLQQFVGWLIAQQKAAAIFALLLEHERGRVAAPPSEVEIKLATPAWRVEHLMRLLKERIGRVELSAPVIALRLEARQLVPLAPPNGDLFPDPGGSPADFARLVEILSARLGTENVLAPRLVRDHRPEVCNTWQPVTEKRQAAKGEDNLRLRPFWLLDKPIPLLLRGERPFYKSPLRTLKGPERLEGGWWDEKIAVRDYYIAQGDNGACYWIYLERVANGRWYLHGMFG